MDDNILILFYSGQIYQALKQTEKALSSYKTCYQLDTTQKDVLETIGQLLLELPIDPGKIFFSMASKSIYIRWIRTVFQPDLKIV